MPQERCLKMAMSAFLQAMQLNGLTLFHHCKAEIIAH